MKKHTSTVKQNQRPTAANWATIARWQLDQVEYLINADATNLDAHRRRLRKAEQLLEHLRAKHGSSYNSKRSRLEKLVEACKPERGCSLVNMLAGLLSGPRPHGTPT